MDKIKLPGRLIDPLSIRPKCQERSISFKAIYSLMEKNELLKPPFQTDIDEDKVNEMIKSYYNNKDYIIFKNKVVISVIVTQFSPNEINYKMYVIDGQHRLEMARRLIERDNENDKLIFCYYQVENDKEMKKLFIEINKDSHKNSKYVSLNEFKQTIYDDLKLYFCNHRIMFFSQKKKENNKCHSITEFINILVERKYFDRFTSFEKLKEDIETKNKMFYKKIDYKEYLLDDPEIFYVDEKISVENGYIYALKNNNFIDYLLDNKVTPDHKFKKSKDTIPPRLRILVWTRWYGENNNGPCPICNTTIKIGKNGFHCGHIKSEANGGETNLDNLRPICSTCNFKMGAMNWDDMLKKIKNN